MNRAAVSSELSEVCMNIIDRELISDTMESADISLVGLMNTMNTIIIAIVTMIDAPSV